MMMITCFVFLLLLTTGRCVLSFILFDFVVFFYLFDYYKSFFPFSDPNNGAAATVPPNVVPFEPTMHSTERPTRLGGVLASPSLCDSLAPDIIFDAPHTNVRPLLPTLLLFLITVRHFSFS